MRPIPWASASPAATAGRVGRRRAVPASSASSPRRDPVAHPRPPAYTHARTRHVRPRRSAHRTTGLHCPRRDRCPIRASRALPVGARRPPRRRPPYRHWCRVRRLRRRAGGPPVDGAAQCLARAPSAAGRCRLPGRGRPRTKCLDCAPRRGASQAARDIAARPAPKAGTLAGAVVRELEAAGRLDVRRAGRRRPGAAHRRRRDTGAGIAAMVKQLGATMADALRGVAVEGDPLDELRARRAAKETATAADA